MPILGVCVCGRVQYKGASLAVVVFDVNNKESFKSCSKWYQDVKDASPTHNIPGASRLPCS